MNIKAWTRGKKITLSLILAAVLVVCGICAAAYMERQKHMLFHIDSSEVKSITLTASAASREITDRQQIEEIVTLLNDFTYEKAEELSGDLLGQGYRLYLNMIPGRKMDNMDFYADRIRIHKKDAGSVLYFGPAEYFQPLVDLAEEAKQSQ